MHTQRGKLSGLGDHAQHSGKGLGQQWQFVLHDEESLNSDGVEGKWVGGLGSGDLGVCDLEIEKLRTQIAELNKKLQHKQRERDAVAASTGSIAATRDIRAEVVITKSHKKQRKVCACLFCVLCMVGGGIVGSFINSNTGGMRMTGAVALDVVDGEDVIPTNVTDHDVNGRHTQVIPPIGAEGLNRRPPAGPCRLFLGPGFRLAARWNRLVETVKTRKKREKTGGKWARYGLKGVKDGS